MKLKSEIYCYLEEIFGQAPELVSLNEDYLRGLPFYLANIYQFFDCELFGKRLVFAQPKELESTPAEFAQQVIKLQDHFKVPVVLLLSHIEAYQRNRLVQMGVSFIVPRRQLFLPQLMIDLRDHYPRAACKMKKYVSPPTQLVILYHLLVEDIGGFSLRELSRRTGYSAMTFTKVQDELEVCGLCDIEQVGRSKYIHFKFKGKKLWNKSLPFLRSPVRSVKALREIPSKVSIIRSGISALSEYTLINPDRIPTYAIKESVFRKALMNGEAVVTSDRDEAVAMIELWAYDPGFIELLDDNSMFKDVELKQNQFVDKLSLFLSLRNDPNERVQGELERMMESVSW